MFSKLATPHYIVQSQAADNVSYGKHQLIVSTASKPLSLNQTPARNPKRIENYL
jgi:hypothetical protein